MELAENPKGCMVCLYHQNFSNTLQETGVLCCWPAPAEEQPWQKPLWVYLSCDGTGSVTDLPTEKWCRLPCGCLRTCPGTEWARKKIHKLLLGCAWHNMDKISQEKMFFLGQPSGESCMSGVLWWQLDPSCPPAHSHLFGHFVPAVWTLTPKAPKPTRLFPDPFHPWDLCICKRRS